MKLVIVGATGLVGGEVLKVLEEFSFPLDILIPVASKSSVGKTINYAGKSWTVQSIEDAIAAKADIAIFSAGGETSTTYAPMFAEVGAVVIDNSSAWRMTDLISSVVNSSRSGVR